MNVRKRSRTEMDTKLGDAEGGTTGLFVGSVDGEFVGTVGDGVGRTNG